jgi:hypothetical protein
MKSGEKLIMSSAITQFKPTGPKWSFMPKRKEQRWDLPLQSDGEAMVILTSVT